MKSIIRFIITAIGLGICGIVFAIIGAYIGGGLIGETTFGALGLAVIGILGGYLLGIIVGIILIKYTLHQPGSLLFGITGGIIGAAVTVIAGISWDPTAPVLFTILFFCIPVFSLAGFYLKR
jgi:hypothetical protein